MPPYATTGQKLTYYGFRISCGLIFLFLIAPIVVIIPLSFNQDPFFSYPMKGYSLRWYDELFGDGPLSILWQRSFINSVVIAVGSTLLATVLGTLAALGLSRGDFPLKKLTTAILISPIVVPIIVTAIGLFYFYAQIGLVSTHLGIILAHATLGAPFVVITVSASLAGFDHTLVRAGSILGANPVRVFRKVTLPIIFPGVASGGLFAFATSWDEIVVTIFLASTEQHTIPRRMWSGIRDHLSPAIIAAATLLILLSIVLMLTMEWLRRRGERLRGASPS